MYFKSKTKQDARDGIWRTELHSWKAGTAAERDIDGCRFVRFGFFSKIFQFSYPNQALVTHIYFGFLHAKFRLSSGKEEEELKSLWILVRSSESQDQLTQSIGSVLARSRSKCTNDAINACTLSCRFFDFSSPYDYFRFSGKCRFAHE